MATNQRPAKQLLPALERIGGVVSSESQSSAAAFSGVCYDSRKVQPGDAFVCIEGDKFDGNKFIDDAIKLGAGCIVSQRENTQPLSVPYVKVPDVRAALADLAAYYYDEPSTKIRLIGVTGTNGKTTTTHLVEHIFLEDRRKIGLIGTLGARWSEANQPSQYLDTHHTTPQASDLQALLGEMASKNVSHVAMEVSSHALSLERVRACDFVVACLTNVTQDHLDFHKTMDNYWKAKRILFEMLAKSRQTNKTAVINADDDLALEFIKATSGSDVRTWTYGWDAGDMHVKSAEFDFRGTNLKLETPHGELDLRLHLNGRFNVYNVMAALLICMAEGVDLEVCKEALEDFTGVAGRFETVTTGGNSAEPLCLVDYAHTPDGLENVLKAARALVPKDGRLIAVFGCGGDRDDTKRPQMGQIADNLADLLVVTSDNPRSEKPKSIIDNILSGIKRTEALLVEEDRATAIALAVKAATDKDIVVVAGKGHETYQILADRTIDFDDRIEVRKALTDRLKAAR
ncbi:MAG: UDP-N-acetylmuramoyl-L-alanyl-D-glutamate--2,6-diaminopimelate ligase [Candidatus Melainabacteria bacterium]|nr:UDP-N-acetylmuramoyl-L-alanyl-D-glutamate--2,6-diaminopimelate ligase [Candidatus Melainabacteria bacterium]